MEQKELDELNGQLDEMLLKLFNRWKEAKQDNPEFPKTMEAQAEVFLEIISERLPDLLVEKGKNE